MFGLKLINKRKFEDLLAELKYYKNAVDEYSTLVGKLEGEIKGLNSENVRLAQKVQSLETPKKSETILLTDVAETPLEVEPKTIKRRTVKKSSKKSS